MGDLAGVTGMFLTLGVLGVMNGLIGRSIAKYPPSGYSAGAGRARALARQWRIWLRLGTVGAVIGVVLLIVLLAVG